MHNNKQCCVTFSGKQSYQIYMAMKVQLNMVFKFCACWLQSYRAGSVLSSVKTCYPQ